MHADHGDGRWDGRLFGNREWGSWHQHNPSTMFCTFERIFSR
jgi:hypothetical protein